tara:strand:+ start:424 stop:1239 length:816 start_codon:yes stop_codon:yes gene_type:complete
MKANCLSLNLGKKMITSAALLFVINQSKWLIEKGGPFLAKYWKQILIGILLLRVFICCLTHYDGNAGTSDSVVVHHRDTVKIIDNSWHLTLGDTIAFYEAKLKERKWTAPVIELTDASTKADSLDEYKIATEQLTGQLDDCDSTYRKDYALRHYPDTIIGDSLDLIVDVKIRGKYAEKPKYSWSYKIPNLHITDSIIIEHPAPSLRRVMYLGGAAGPQLQAIGNDFNSMVFQLELGYMDKKSHQYGLAAQYTTDNQYAVLVKFGKAFQFGK